MIAEALQGYAQPRAMKKSGNFLALAQTYKQLNAPFGAFGMSALKASTRALASNDAGDATYTSIQGQIQSLTTQRNAVAAQIKALLNGAEFDGQVIGGQQANDLINQANALLNQMNQLAQ